MIGCCGAGREKFITIKGKVDQQRLDSIVDYYEKRYAITSSSAPEDKMFIEKIKSCRCLCHKDGANCFC